MAPVAPRIINSVSFVMKMNHDGDFSWQVHYVVTLEGRRCCSEHCK